MRCELCIAPYYLAAFCPVAILSVFSSRAPGHAFYLFKAALLGAAFRPNANAKLQHHGPLVKTPAAYFLTVACTFPVTYCLLGRLQRVKICKGVLIGINS